MNGGADPTGAVSLIIVSRHRTQALLRALRGVAQSDHPHFEVIVVADPRAAAAVRTTGLPLKLATFDTANISAARNLGLALAAAPVVAFMDDDAVPESTWLSRLTAPFADPRVVQAGGFVRGRSGLAWQWRAAWIRGDGTDAAFEAPPGPSLHPGTATHALKTQGTNCAFRTADLRAIGGFDEGFRFYLDEADVNLRLAARGGLSALVPDAVVHHSYLASARRRADRTPTDLRDIGASCARFTARHAPDDPGALDRLLAHHRRRLTRLVCRGALAPWTAVRLMAGLRAGARETAVTAAPAPPAIAPLPMIPLPGTGPRPGRVIAGRLRDREALEARARDAVAAGEIVTLILLDRGIRPHRMAFMPGGYWLQSGGRFGRSERAGPRIVADGRAVRVKVETERLERVRPTNGGSLPE